MRMKNDSIPLYTEQKCYLVTVDWPCRSESVTRCFCNTHLCEVHLCEFCGKEFHSKRSHTRTCSQMCRTALCRLKKREFAVTNYDLGLKQARLKGG